VTQSPGHILSKAAIADMDPGLSQNYDSIDLTKAFWHTVSLRYALDTLPMPRRREPYKLIECKTALTRLKRTVKAALTPG
jgi:hypothetical protein